VPVVVEVTQWCVVVLLCVVLIIGSISDIRHRRIPNWTILAVCCLSVPWLWLGPGPPVLSALAAMLIAFVVTWPVYAFGLFGAGDSKLLTAASLFVGLEKLLFLFVAVAVAGGLIAMISLMLEPTRALVLFHMRGKGGYGKDVPYGVAIAIATALIVVWPLAGVT
jgi:prepilin peptidase CpaA